MDTATTDVRAICRRIEAQRLKQAEAHRFLAWLYHKYTVRQAQDTPVIEVVYELENIGNV